MTKRDAAGTVTSQKTTSLSGKIVTTDNADGSQLIEYTNSNGTVTAITVATDGSLTSTVAGETINLDGATSITTFAAAAMAAISVLLF